MSVEPFSAGEPDGAVRRASDADREHVVGLLHKAYADGRLDATAHASRVEAVYQADTLTELAVLHADLAPPVPNTAVGAASKVTAILSSTRRGGRWVLHTRTVVSALLGRVTLDLNEMLVPEHENVIVAHAIFGKVTVHVPPGVLVRDEGIAFLGSRSSTGRAEELSVGPETPTIELRGIALFGQVTVRRS